MLISSGTLMTALATHHSVTPSFWRASLGFLASTAILAAAMVLIAAL